MKRLLYIAGGVLALLLIAAGTLPFLVPSSVYRSQIESSASEALGRQVTLDGDVSLSIFPRISASIEGVRVANPEGFSRENMIAAGQLRGVVKWGPLLSRRVEIAEIAFIDADVMLERRADGETNWTFGAESEPAPEPESPAPGRQVDAGIDRARLVNARLIYADAMTGAYYDISELDLTASAAALDEPLALEAAGLFQGAAFEIRLGLDSPQTLLDGAPAELDVVIETGGGAASYRGKASLADAVVLDGTFSVNARDVSGLAALAGVDAPINLDALGRVRADGTIAGPLGGAALRFERLSLAGPGLAASYAGGVTLGEVPEMSGRFEADSRDLSSWLGRLGLELPPAASVLKDVSVAADLAGPVDALKLTGLNVTQQGPMLDARFDGTIQLGETPQLGGRLAASSGKLRDLLEALDVALEDGETMQRFSLEGELAGTFDALRFEQVAASLDEVRASGVLDLRLDGPRPYLGGRLTTGRLDLSPFLTSPQRSAQPQPTGWSEAQLDLAGLKSVDVDVALTADQIVLDKIALGAPDLAARIENGRLVADIRTMQVFGGTWGGQFSLDASAGQPVMQMNLTGQAIDLNAALLGLAGLDALSGMGEFKIDVRASGDSLKALVSGLSGEMSTQLLDGAIKGLNVGQLVRSRENLLEALANGTLQMALAPEAETDFTSMVAGLQLTNGIARVQRFSVINPVVTLEGSGQIDLAGRSLDLSIVPRVDTRGTGQGSALELNNVPIPFRISGDWLAPKLTPDTAAIQNIVRQDVEDRVVDEVRDRIGEEAGTILDTVLGRPPATTPPPADPATPDTTPGTTEQQATPAQTPEEALRDLAREQAGRALGGLIGRRTNTPAETAPAPEPDTSAPEAETPQPAETDPEPAPEPEPEPAPQ